ncbi:MAG: WecB/TagA/CpsF family glycosyltransferase [Candidatus Amesbacteria bacterium]|nr:WecB/TagA/CpsF family glycosyltransferase [Candidatus Amesbacteria bacterium]
MKRNRANILGVVVDSTNLVEVLRKIDIQVQNPNRRKPFFVVTVNPEFILLAQNDPEFKNILNSADLAIADGVGLKLAGIKNIIPGRKLVAELLEKPYKFFFLGGQNGVAGEMVKKYGGTFDEGEFDKTNPSRNNEILKKINKYKPDILLVAYGAPWQEKWIWNNLSDIHTRVCIGIGGAFDYLTGKTILPPKLVEKGGFEWLWRLVHEPWRWRRQLNLVRFIIDVLRTRIWSNLLASKLT